MVQRAKEEANEPLCAYLRTSLKLDTKTLPVSSEKDGGKQAARGERAGHRTQVLAVHLVGGCLFGEIQPHGDMAARREQIGGGVRMLDCVQGEDMSGLVVQEDTVGIRGSRSEGNTSRTFISKRVGNPA